MKKMLRTFGVLVAIVAIFALIACAPAAQPTAAPPTSAPAQPTAAPAQPTAAPAQPTAAPAQPTAAPAQPTAAPAAGSAADTLVIVKNITDVISFDPAEVYEFSGILGSHSIYDTLVKFEGTDMTAVKPGLAESWDIKAVGDTQELTFHLKDGLKFASGNPVTADDVVYSIQRVIALNKPPAFLMTDVGKLTKDSVKATDPKTVVFTFPKDVSVGAFLTVLTGPTGGIVDSKEAKAHEVNGDFGNTYLKDKSAGSGPYMLDHWTKDVEFLLKANPNAAVTPKTPNVLVKHIDEGAVQQSVLTKGDADIAFDLTPEQVASLKDNKDIQALKAGNLQLFYVGLNQKLKPLDNPKVREALRYAIDYDAIANELLSGNAQVNQNVIPIGMLGANPDAGFKKDVEKAKALLKEAGFENGFEIDVQTISGNVGIVPMSDLAAKLQADWADIGVKANIKALPQAELLGPYREGKAPVVVLLWGPDFADPDANATPFTGAPLGLTRNNYDDPKARDMAKAAALETDPTKRAAMYKELEDYFAHNGPFIFLFQPQNLYALRSNVQGFEWNPIGYTDLSAVSK